MSALINEDLGWKAYKKKHLNYCGKQGPICWAPGEMLHMLIKGSLVTAFI